MKKEYLYGLVQALSKAEKRNFRLFLGKYNLKEASKSSLLFDALCNSNSYDKQKLLIKFEGVLTDRSFTYEKHRLLQSLLNFLTSFYQEKSIEQRLNAIMIQVYALQSKNQKELCLNLIEKAIQMAEENHLTIYIYQFLREKNEMLHQFANKLHLQKEISERLVQLLEDLSTENRYEQIYRRLVVAHFDEHKINFADQWEWLKKDEYYMDESLATTFRSKHILYQAKFIFNLWEDSSKSLTYSKKSLDLTRSSKSYVLNNLQSYIGGYLNYLRALIESNRISEAAIELNALWKEGEKYKSKLDKGLDVYFKRGFYSTQIDIFRFQFKYQEIMDLLDNEELDVKQFFANSFDLRETEYFYEKACALFALGYFEKVMDEVYQFELEKDVDVHATMYYNMKMLNNLAHYERKKDKSIESQFNALYYFCGKNELQDDTISFQLKILRKISQMPEEKELLVYMNQLNDLCNEVRSQVDELDLFFYWWDSKLKKSDVRSIIEAAGRKLSEQ